MESLARRISREGPLPFSLFMNEALYGADGFYTGGGGAGRRRDFLTSPEVGALFGMVLARLLDDWWVDLGRPDPYMVAEVGAGPGSLARSIIDARPFCSAALRYLLVDRSGPMRALHRSIRLPLADSSTVLGEIARTEDNGFDGGDVAGTASPAQGPLCASLEALPGIELDVVLANELLDNIAVDLYERGETGWREIRVGIERPPREAELCEVVIDAEPSVSSKLDALLPSADVGTRISYQPERVAWLREALATTPRGRVLCIDYARSTSDMAALPWQQWLRTYRMHSRGGHPLLAPGETDITVDVAVDQLAAGCREPTFNRSQAEFLRAHGIDAIAAEQRALWEAGASRGDLASLTARSRAQELEALCDVSGLGGFRVLEWW